MKMKNLLYVVLCGAALLFQGCYSSVDGRHRAGVPFSTDKFESRYQRTNAQVFASAKKVLERIGKLYGENTIARTLEAKVDTKTVWVKVTDVEPNVTQLTVQVRTRGGSADVITAAQIDKEIALDLSTTR